MYMCVPASLSTHCMYPWKPEVEVGYSETGVIGGFESSDMDV